MEKNIAHPTDAQLYERAREQLVALAQEAGAELRQSYARLVLQVGRYAHAKQFKRMRKALKRLKGYTGRVMRDLRRHLQDKPRGWPARQDHPEARFGLATAAPAAPGGRQDLRPA